MLLILQKKVGVGTPGIYVARSRQIIKLNDSGEEVWRTSNFSDNVHDIVVTSDDIPIVSTGVNAVKLNPDTGEVTSTIVGGGNPNAYDCSLAIDSTYWYEEDVRWNIATETMDANFSRADAYSISIDENRNLYVFGVSGYSNNPTKVDSSGNEVWDASQSPLLFNGTYIHYRDSFVYAAGQTTSNYLFRKMNATTGATVWDYNSSPNIAGAVVADADGNAYLGANTAIIKVNSDGNEIISNTSVPAGVRDMIWTPTGLYCCSGSDVMKYDSMTLQQQWRFSESNIFAIGMKAYPII
jgi:hypothetical protein